jgi:hypothetical protein
LTSIPQEAATREGRRELSRKTKIVATIVAIVLVAAGAAAAYVVATQKVNPVTKETAKNFLVGPSDFEGGYNISEFTESLGKQLQDSCLQKKPLLDSMKSGKTWASIGIQNEQTSTDVYWMGQKIYSDSHAHLVKTAETELLTATDPSCDGDTTLLNMKLHQTVEKPRSIREAFGANLEGVTLHYAFRGCFAGESLEQNNCSANLDVTEVFAFRDEVAMTFVFLDHKESKAAAVRILKKFAE